MADEPDETESSMGWWKYFLVFSLCIFILVLESSSRRRTSSHQLPDHLQTYHKEGKNGLERLNTGLDGLNNEKNSDKFDDNLKYEENTGSGGSKTNEIATTIFPTERVAARPINKPTDRTDNYKYKQNEKKNENNESKEKQSGEMAQNDRSSLSQSNLSPSHHSHGSKENHHVIYEAIHENVTINNNFTFSVYPHKRIFDGFLEEGQWIAGDLNRTLTRLKLMPSIESFDLIQKQAILEGVFLPSRYKAKFHLFSSKEANDCLEGRKVYFFGDSYIQQTFIGLGDILLNDPSSFEIKNGSVRNAVANITSIRLEEHFANRSMTFVRVVLNECHHGDLSCILEGIANDSSLFTADAFIGNVLIHHLVAHQTESNFMTIYVRQLRDLFKLRSDLKLTWATGPSYAINRVPKQYRNVTASRPTEYMNFKAMEVADEMSVPLLDFFSLTHACKWENCSADGGHRSRFVNRMKAQMILNNMCKRQ